MFLFFVYILGTDSNSSYIVVTLECDKIENEKIINQKIHIVNIYFSM